MITIQESKPNHKEFQIALKNAKERTYSACDGLDKGSEGGKTFKIVLSTDMATIYLHPPTPTHTQS